MVQLYFSQTSLQPILLERGDRVRYIGSDPKIRSDYGNQELTVLAFNPADGISVCKNGSGQLLVGVHIQDLERLL